MQIAQVENGEIIRWDLPKTGYLKDGSSVSGYDLRMIENPELAKQEGWLPLEDIKPTYNQDTQYLIDDGYEVLEDRVVKKYKVENMPEPEITDEYVDEEKIAMAEAIIDLEMRLAELEKIQGGNV